MLSLTNSLRTAARHAQAQWPRSLAAAAAPRRANSSSAGTDSMADLRGILHDAGDAPQAPQRVSRIDYNEIDPRAAMSRSTAGSLKFFRTGQFVKPYDFTREERTKSRRFTSRPLLGPDAKTSREKDIFHKLDIDPLDECMNSALLSHFVTDMGKIQKRSVTQLTWKNQRRLGKAIRRAKMMGIIPILSRRPLSLIESY
ncbi:hypothetical protein WOLCODRAFT_16919 [Wolfiporia cocos MD-104 SS10]|uniref:Small ribosomal subunit protein bS18m n=1 Tax=Wolfiporia cocos (strain MD-104) TaxID=742152 RepID=A0A2H3JQR9_WOLCO|nr:hypothetical protein WOLCODRAFT_16919 [Wolfiporia cocos MD-104 SS10]